MLSRGPNEPNDSFTATIMPTIMSETPCHVMPCHATPCCLVVPDGGCRHDMAWHKAIEIKKSGCCQEAKRCCVERTCRRPGELPGWIATRCDWLAKIRYIRIALDEAGPWIGKDCRPSFGSFSVATSTRDTRARPSASTGHCTIEHSDHCMSSSERCNFCPLLTW